MMIHPCAIIRAAEQAAFASGSATPSGLMDAVVKRLWDAVSREPALPRSPRRVVVYAGKGNNAGDALGLAARFSCPVTVRSVCQPGAFSEETRRQFALLSDREVSTDTPDAQEGLLIIDGLLGSGAAGELRSDYARMVLELNTLRNASPHSCTLAIDVPTGLQADTGHIGIVTVQADVTAAIGCVKPGMLRDGVEDYVGRLLCIPLPEVALPVTEEVLVADDSLQSWLPRRRYSCYKNRAGRVNIIAGSIGYIGAAHLCTAAAVQAGAGLVALYCPHDIYPILAARADAEVMVHPVRSYAEVPCEGVQAMVIGPGLGHLPEREEIALEALLNRFPGPVVLDADGLNLAAERGWNLPPHCILTPHPGEMRRLYPGSVNMSRAETVRRYVAAHGCTLLLKGARTITSNGARTLYNSTGGPYMANGGQGDALSGVIAALAAQGLPPLQAAALGAYRCGLAAALAWQEAGRPAAIPASQVIRHLPRVS